MSRLFNAFYFSAENGYGDEATFRRNQDNEINAAWELEEAKEDLEIGIADNLPEFVWLEETINVHK